ncbi:MAG: exo-alpha-sialidase [Planctomycetota bacterium]
MGSMLLIASVFALASVASVAAAPPVGDPTDIFVGGEGGYPVYRIPAATRLATGPRAGRLLAFAEGRPQLADVTDNDIVLRTSDDGGATWSAVRVLADVAGRSLNNPCVAEVRDGPRAGRVLLMFQSYPENHGESHVVEGYGSGDGPDRVCRTLVAHSDDGGETWSAPREVTREVKREKGATSTATGPGIGIQLLLGAHKGRVIMPFNEGPFDRWRVYAAYSDDGGDTWRAGEVAPNDAKGLANEVQMFERTDGSVMLNARQHLGAKRRKSAVSSDGGATWSTLRDIPDLPDPTCMGGVLALGGGTVVFTGCDSESRRALGTAWFSRDDGASWPAKVLVEPGGFGYSVPVALDPTTVGVVYETAGYKRIVMRRVTVPAAQDAPAAR